MRKKFAKISLLIMCLGFIISMILIIKSSDIGVSKGRKELIISQGLMDTAVYDRIIDNTITDYRIAGITLSVLSGVGILFSGYAWYKEL